MSTIKLTNVKKVYDNKVVAVHDFNLDIQDKEFIVFVGPSGCGKSTTLRMIAGLEEISGGTVEIDGRVVNDLPPKDRNIAMVFQNYALYPHLSVFDNIAFPLTLIKQEVHVPWTEKELLKLNEKREKLLKAEELQDSIIKLEKENKRLGALLSSDKKLMEDIKTGIPLYVSNSLKKAKKGDFSAFPLSFLMKK